MHTYMYIGDVIIVRAITTRDTHFV